MCIFYKKNEKSLAVHTQVCRSVPEFPSLKKDGNFYRKYGKNLLQNANKRCIIYKWLWEPDASSTDRDILPVFADFVPQEMKYVAFIAACPSVGRL